GGSPGRRPAAPPTWTRRPGTSLRRRRPLERSRSRPPRRWTTPVRTGRRSRSTRGRRSVRARAHVRRGQPSQAPIGPGPSPRAPRPVPPPNRSPTNAPPRVAATGRADPSTPIPPPRGRRGGDREGTGGCRRGDASSHASSVDDLDRLVGGPLDVAVGGEEEAAPGDQAADVGDLHRPL